MYVYFIGHYYLEHAVRVREGRQGQFFDSQYEIVLKIGQINSDLGHVLINCCLCTDEHIYLDMFMLCLKVSIAISTE